MVLTADYHTHTVFSHGKGDIIDNATVAKNIGLTQLGISDHGFAHPAFGLRKHKLPIMREKCDNASKVTGVETLLGIESNIISVDGRADLSEKNYDYFDIFLAGIHKFVIYDFKSIFSLSIPNLYHNYVAKNNIPKWVVNDTTKAYINLVKKAPIDIITHLNFCCFADSEEVAKACADYGTYLEISAKKEHLTDDEFEKILKTDVKFVIGSDAHSPNRVGEISLAENLINRINLPLDRIMNIDGRLPDFRFKNFKGNAGKSWIFHKR